MNGALLGLQTLWQNQPYDEASRSSMAKFDSAVVTGDNVVNNGEAQSQATIGASGLIHASKRLEHGLLQALGDSGTAILYFNDDPFIM